MRTLLLLFILAITTIAAFANGHWLLFRLAYALGIAIVLCYVWSWLNIRWLEISRRTRTLRAQVGKEAEERFVVRNTGPLPKLWIELQDLSDMPGHNASAVISLGAHRSFAWTVRTLCRMRGEFTLGPIVVTSSDPFGLFQHRRVIPDKRTLLVLPRVVDLPGFAIPTGELQRDSSYNKRTQHVTPKAAGVRDYVPGDGLNCIHWPTTARTGKLMAKEFEMDPSSDVWVLLDLHAMVHAGEGEDSTEEYGVLAAASLTKRLLEAGLAVGLIAYDRTPRILLPDRGPRQLVKALEWLAVVRARGTVPLAELMTAESTRFNRHSTLVIVTPSTDERWVTSLQLLLQRGVKAVAIVQDVSTFGVHDSALLVVSALAACGVPTYLIKKGGDLGQALVTPQLGPSYSYPGAG